MKLYLKNNLNRNLQKRFVTLLVVIQKNLIETFEILIVSKDSLRQSIGFTRIKEILKSAK